MAVGVTTDIQERAARPTDKWGINRVWRKVRTNRDGNSKHPAARAAVLPAVLALTWLPATTEAGAAGQDDPQPQVEEQLCLSAEEIDARGLTAEEIEALGLSRCGPPAGPGRRVAVGTRARPRTVAESPVPVDVLTPSDLTSQGAVNSQDQLPFSVNTQPISDASTVVRPAMLRNLAPDHTLVLINGKRRHRSSIIDWYGGNGVTFGSQGPDISVIPSIALRQVEVLRDGAAAQEARGNFVGWSQGESNLSLRQAGIRESRFVCVGECEVCW